MPVFILSSIFYLLYSIFYIHPPKAFGATPTSPYTIKFRSFTPIPTKTPTKTPIPTATRIPTITPSRTPPPPLPTTPPPPATVPPPTLIPQQPAWEVVDLVNQIRTYCGGGIYGTNPYYAFNLNCVQKMQFPTSIDNAVKDELYFSAQGNWWLQCVGFARAAADRTNLKAMEHIYGNAIDYASFARPSGYTFIQKRAGVTIKVHDLPVWNYDTYGHIAYVIKVYNAYNFQVAEANLGCSGCARIFNKTIDDPHLIGWLRKV